MTKKTAASPWDCVLHLRKPRRRPKAKPQRPPLLGWSMLIELAQSQRGNGKRRRKV